ncbi:MAG: hypothetical protein MJE77_10445 [Proteobacteria bacterium]|nr:hypothetical protein [Pseudomonadota bacterium]
MATTYGCANPDGTATGGGQAYSPGNDQRGDQDDSERYHHDDSELDGEELAGVLLRAQAHLSHGAANNGDWLPRNSSYCPEPLGSFNYCSWDCPCGAGQGDCDYDDHCTAGTVCIRDVGILFGYGAGVDVCMEPCSELALGSPEFCDNCPCESGQGDCDSDSECASGLVCAWDLGPAFGFGPEVDVCIEPCDDIQNGTSDFCSSACPCDRGQSDCDDDSDCIIGLVCGENIGLHYGYGADDDVCVEPCNEVLNGTYDFCSTSCPCEHGQGDCDHDSDCAPGHVCVHNVGADYGFRSGIDVCVSPVTPQERFAGKVIDSLGRAMSGATVSINQQGRV